MMALMVLIGDEELEAYESRLLDMIEPCEVEDERRRELRMLEKERDWKRVVRILANENEDWWDDAKVSGYQVGLDELGDGRYDR
jgi:hypothetical protein